MINKSSYQYLRKRKYQRIDVLLSWREGSPTDQFFRPCICCLEFDSTVHSVVVILVPGYPGGSSVVLETSSVITPPFTVILL